jgi:hypothetical protein
MSSIYSIGNNPTYFDIDSTGAVTFPLQPAFLAYLPTSDTNATGNGTIYTLGSGTALTSVFDRGSNFNSNGTFTAPVTGIYLFSLVLQVSNMTLMTESLCSIITTARTYKGGIINPTTVKSLSGIYSFSMTQLCDMSVNDTATFTCRISNGLSASATIVGSSSPYSSYVSGHLVA